MKVEVITHDKHIIDSVIFHIFFSTQTLTMLMQRPLKSVTIVEMALSVWAIIHLADAFDHCDVRHKFTNDKGKYLPNYFNNSKCFFHLKYQKCTKIL